MANNRALSLSSFFFWKNRLFTAMLIMKSTPDDMNMAKITTHKVSSLSHSKWLGSAKVFQYSFVMSNSTSPEQVQFSIGKIGVDIAESISQSG